MSGRLTEMDDRSAEQANRSTEGDGRLADVSDAVILRPRGSYDWSPRLVSLGGSSI